MEVKDEFQVLKIKVLFVFFSFFLRLSMLYEIFGEEFLKIMCSLVYIFIRRTYIGLINCSLESEIHSLIGMRKGVNVEQFVVTQ